MFALKFKIFFITTCVLIGTFTNACAQSTTQLIPYPLKEKVSKPLISAEGNEVYFTLFRKFETSVGPSESPGIFKLGRDVSGSFKGELLYLDTLTNSRSSLIFSISANNRQFYVLSKPWRDFKDIGIWYDKGYQSKRKYSERIFHESILSENGKVIYIPHFLKGFKEPKEFLDYSIASNGHILIASFANNKSKDPKEDIYIAFREELDLWSPFQKLSDVVNSSANDFGVFLAHDQKTLYFSSDRDAEGEFRLYMTRRLDSTWMNWSEPVLLDDSINDAPINLYLSLTANGESGIMTKRRKVEDRSYLYKINLAEEFQANPSRLLIGEVLDKSSIIAKQLYEVHLFSGKRELEGKSYMFKDYSSYGFYLRERDPYTLKFFDKDGHLIEEITIEAGSENLIHNLKVSGS